MASSWGSHPGTRPALHPKRRVSGRRFLSDTRETARRIFQAAGEEYGKRSKFVHGRRAADLVALPIVETWVRDAVTKIIDDGLVETFSDPKKRSAYLEALPFAGRPEAAADDGSGAVTL